MRFAILFCIVIPSIACNRKPAPSVAIDAGVPAVAITSSKVAAFKEKTAAYLDESRAGAKMLTLSPSAEDMRRRSLKIHELYAQIPEVPPEVDSTGAVAERFQRIQRLFDVSRDHVAAIPEHEKHKDEQAIRKIYQLELPATAKQIQGLIDEIEAKVGVQK